MGLVEIHPRTFNRRFGEKPSASRSFIDTPDAYDHEPLPVIGQPHPEFATLICITVNKTTGGDDPRTIKYQCSYEPAPSCEQEPNPVDRCDRWAVTLSSSTVPCTTHLIDDGAGLVEKPLLNTAGEPISNVKKRNADVRMAVQGNRASFPLQTVLANVNKVNSDTWASGASGTWLCSGASATQETEIVENLAVDFWSVSFEFLYRPSGWTIPVQNVGMNYLRSDTNGKRYLYRVSVRAPDNSLTAAPTPQPLNDDGTLKTTGEPTIRQIAVYNYIDFNVAFGEPPTDEDE